MYSNELRNIATSSKTRKTRQHIVVTVAIRKVYLGVTEGEFKKNRYYNHPVGYCIISKP